MQLYNRYIPQNDGTYRKKSIPDPSAPIRMPPETNTPDPASDASGMPPQQNKPIPPARYRPAGQRRANPRPIRKPNPDPSGKTVSAFLRQLLPGDFDTCDLLVVILLLLMSNDCAEEQNTALLTLALYLFL